MVREDRIVMSVKELSRLHVTQQVKDYQIVIYTIMTKLVAVCFRKLVFYQLRREIIYNTSRVSCTIHNCTAKIDF